MQSLGREQKVAYAVLVALASAYVAHYFPQYGLGVLLIALGVYTLLGVKYFEYVPLALALAFYGYSQPYSVAVIALATAFAWVPSSYSFFLALGASILSSTLPDAYNFLALIALAALLRYFGLEVRGLVVSGIALLVYSALTGQYSGPFANTSYLDLVVGVGAIASETSVGKKTKTALSYVALLLPSVSFLALGLPKSLYYLETGSFLFKLDPFSLWFPGIGYFPILNQFLLLWLESHFIGSSSLLLVPAFAYLASVLAYRAFKLANAPVPLLWALVYGFLTPYWDPTLLLPYLGTPLIYILFKKINNLTLSTLAGMTIVTLFSSNVGFPFLAPLIAFFAGRRNEFLPLLGFFLGASAFWLLPFIVLGYGLTVPINPLPFYLIAASFVSLALISNGLARRAEAVVPLVGLFGFLYMGLSPYYPQSVYPLAVFALLLSSAYLKEIDLKPLVAVSLVATGLVLSAYSTLAFTPAPTSYSFSNLASVKGSLTDFVYWLGPYNLSSPSLLTSNQTWAKYVVKFSNGKVSVTNRTNVVTFYKVLPYVRPNANISVKPYSSANLVTRNYYGAPAYVLWYPVNVPGYSTIFLYSPLLGELQSLSIKANTTDLTVTVVLYNGTTFSFVNATNLTLPKGTSLIHVTKFFTSATPVNISLIEGKSYNGTELLFLGFPKPFFPRVNLSLTWNGVDLKVSSLKSYEQLYVFVRSPDNMTVIEFNGSTYSNLSLDLPPGTYVFHVVFKYSYLETYGFLLTLVSYVLAVFQRKVYELGRKAYLKLPSLVNESSRGTP